MAADARIRVLAGCSARIDQCTFDAYWRSLTALVRPSDTEVHYAFVDDSGGTLCFPDDAHVLPAPPRPEAAQYAVGSDTHHWNVATFEHLAACKQLLLDHARSNGYTHVLLVDSDLLLEPTTLVSLLSLDTDVANAIFWTKWSPSDPPMPQCWLTHPYGLHGLGMRQHEYLRALHERQVVRVLGGGACMLVRTAVLDKLHYHPRLPLPEGGMWQGEDRTFAVLAQQAHIRQYADAWPNVHHAYRPEDRAQSALDAAWERLNVPQQFYAKLGDWVALRLTPMEDPPLEDALQPDVQCIRGRLGRIPLHDTIERAVLDMSVGERRIVDVTFAEGHPVYPPCTKAIMIEFIAVRPHEQHH